MYKNDAPRSAEDEARHADYLRRVEENRRRQIIEEDQSRERQATEARREACQEAEKFAKVTELREEEETRLMIKNISAEELRAFAANWAKASGKKTAELRALKVEMAALKKKADFAEEQAVTKYSRAFHDLAAATERLALEAQMGAFLRGQVAELNKKLTANETELKRMQIYERDDATPLLPTKALPAEPTDPANDGNANTTLPAEPADVVSADVVTSAPPATDGNANTTRAAEPTVGSAALVSSAPPATDAKADLKTGLTRMQIYERGKGAAAFTILVVFFLIAFPGK